MTRIFISHSHADEAIADLLIDFLGEAMKIAKEDIRCTSDPNHGLDFSSSSISDQLKNDLKNAGALIVIATIDSLRSPWILFEVGSFWTTDKLVAPIIGPGLTFDDLPGPLRGYRSIQIEKEDVSYQLNELINQIAKKLEIQQSGVTRRRDNKLKAFISCLRAWESQLPATDPSQQQAIEQLEAQIQDLNKELAEARSHSQQQLEDKRSQSTQLQAKIERLEKELASKRSQVEKLQESERSHKEQLEKVQILSQQEKEKLEAASQQQKSEFKQSLQSEIKQLKQQLDQARAQNETDQNEIIRLREQLIERSRKQQLENKKPEPSQAQSFIEKLGNDVKLEMIAIPGGKFMMGSPEGEGNDDEKPQHEVTVQAFYMGKYPITQAQYQQVMGNNPSSFKDDEQRPVENVSWDDAVEFCKKLSKQTGREYRLPSEAEWEYACRAGTTTAYYFGESITGKQVNYCETVGETTAVGKYTPNAFGLYDMHGNVFEWCQDNWHDNYKGAPNDGKAWISGNRSKYVVRGSSWDNAPYNCRSAIRYDTSRDYRHLNIGLRVVCVAPLQ